MIISGVSFVLFVVIDGFNTSLGSKKKKLFYLSIVSGSCSSLLLPISSHSRAGMFNTAGGIVVKRFILKSRWVSFNKLLSWRGRQRFSKCPQCNLLQHSHWQRRYFASRSVYVMLGFYLVVEIHSKFERTIKLNNLQITALIESSSAQRKHIFQNHQAPGFREPAWQKLLFAFCE